MLRLGFQFVYTTAKLAGGLGAITTLYKSIHKISYILPKDVNVTINMI
jgi:hypothetical protein